MQFYLEYQIINNPNSESQNKILIDIVENFQKASLEVPFTFP